VQKTNHTRVFTTSRCNHKGSTTNAEKLQVDTHTKKWGFPSIMIIVTKSRMFWF